MVKTKNTNCLTGLRCPKCGSLEPFNIVCTVVTTFYDAGSDEDHDHEWDDKSYCSCVECGFEGTVKDFNIKRRPK